MRLQVRWRPCIAIGAAVAAAALIGSCGPTAPRPPTEDVPLEFALYCHNLEDGGLEATLVIANRGHRQVLLRKFILATADMKIQYPKGSRSFGMAAMGPVWGTCYTLNGNSFIFLPPTEDKIENLDNREAFTIKRKYEGDSVLSFRRDHPPVILTVEGSVLVFVLDSDADWRDPEKVTGDGRYQARYVGFSVTVPLPPPRL